MTMTKRTNAKLLKSSASPLVIGDGNEEPSRKPHKLAWSIDELTEAGYGSRAYLYEQIGAGRLHAVKRGRRTIVLEAERKRWQASLPAARISYRNRQSEDGSNAA